MKKFIPYIRKLLSTRDLVPKVICLALSIILWIIINSTKVGEVKFTIPVEIKNLPENLAVLEGMNNSATVTLAGRKDLLKSVNVKNINAAVNLENPYIGTTGRYPVDVIKNEMPPGIDFSLSPGELTLTVERKIQKLVRIEPYIRQTEGDNYDVGNVRVDPPYTVISGPESQLKEIDSIRTGFIVRGNSAGRVEKEIIIDRGRLANIKTDVKKVRVNFSVFDTSQFVRSEVMIDVKNGKEGYKYILSRQSVRLYLRPRESALKLEKDFASAFVDVAALRFDYPYRDVGVNIRLKDDAFEAAWVVPDVVSVKIIRK